MDIQYLLFLQKIREICGGVMDSFFLKVTALGEQTVTFLFLAFIYWCVDKKAGQRMGLNVSLACTWNQFLKWKCKIERPWVRDERIVPVKGALAGAGGYSFPSGHTSRVTAIFGTLGAYLWKSKERIISVICWCVVAMVAFSRNLLGVHTPQDILLAFVMGILAVFVVDKALDFAENGKNRDIIVMVVGCLLCFLPMLKAGCLINAGAGMGFFIGWVLERRFIHFDNEVLWQQKVIRFSVGGAGILFILYVIKDALNLVLEAKYAGFFTSFSLAVFIMAVYPFFFCRKERVKKGIWLAAACIVGILLLSVLVTHMKNMETEQESVAEETADLQEASGKEIVPPQIIAHRGYSSEFPENTLASFAGSIDIGADYIELDVQLTKDGQVVVFHDSNLKRITGEEGAISDYTYEELRQMDAGEWFSPDFAGEKIPTLEEALTMIEASECKVYLELKDIGDVSGFEEAVLSVVEQCQMSDRCLFASFRYSYLKHLKKLNADLTILYNTTSGKVTLPEEFPADYYGLYTESATANTVSAIHEAGKKAFVWTVNTPVQMQNARLMGADGLVTNYPGLAKVVRQPEYIYLVDKFESSITMPGLYGASTATECEDMIVQGLTQVGNRLVISAYSHSGERNSILYIMDLQGQLQKIVDLNFKAHVGGIAYDEANDLLWVTGASGKVYAISWSDVLAGTYQGEIQVSFEAGLVNQNGSKVASFLALSEGELFVGSYVNGSNGILKRYSLSEVPNPQLLSAVTIPERIQGLTFRRDTVDGKRYMLLSQGYQTEDSKLLKFVYDDQTENFDKPIEINVLPEGAEQIYASAGGMYILFESAVRPYRATARIPNDQIYLVRE